MKFDWGLPAAIAGVAAMSVMVQPQIAQAALTATELKDVAAEITVLINRQDGNSNGSGVIVAKDGDSYYVLTAAHVVNEDPEQSGFAIVTHDGEKYILDKSTVVYLPDVDLAVFRFSSNLPYRVATLANYDLRSQGESTRSELVFVSGWPAGQERMFNPGQRISEDFTSTLAKKSLNQGYDLLYTSITYPGMSGGPVLDVNGQVIGIHGQSEGEIVSETEAGTDSLRVRLGYSAGIPISTFLSLAPQQGLQLPVQVESVAPVNPNTNTISAFIGSLAPQKPEQTDDERAWVNYGNELWRLGGLYSQSGNPKGIELQEKEVNAYDTARESAPAFYQSWYARGNVMADLGRFEEAVESYHQAIQVFESNYPSIADVSEDELETYATIWRYQGLMLSELKRYPEALTAFNKVIELKDNDFAVWDLRGLAEMQMGDTEAALASFDKALELNSQSQYAWWHKGNAQVALGEVEAGLKSYEMALTIQPNLYLVVLQRAGVLEDFLNHNGNDAQAIDRAIGLNPNDPNAVQRRAFALFGLARRPEAIAIFDQAIANNPNDAASWVARGLTLIAGNRYQAARAAFEKAQQLNPNSLENQQVLQILQQIEELDDANSGLSNMGNQ